MVSLCFSLISRYSKILICRFRRCLMFQFLYFDNISSSYIWSFIWKISSYCGSLSNKTVLCDIIVLNFRVDWIVQFLVKPRFGSSFFLDKLRNIEARKQSFDRKYLCWKSLFGLSSVVSRLDREIRSIFRILGCFSGLWDCEIWPSSVLSSDVLHFRS